MQRTKFSLAAYKDLPTVELVNKTDHKALASWAVACVERVFSFLKKEYPAEQRPTVAIEALQKWIDTGVFKMQVIRKASLDSHAFAKEIGNDSPAASVAHAAGQAVATAHVPLHALGAANYALQAIYRSSVADDADQALIDERSWQLNKLQKLKKKS
jgi:hypothetical protein